MNMTWDDNTRKMFNQLIEKTPVFIREMVKEKVSARAEAFAKENGKAQISEKDMVDAFFKETPGGFWGPLTIDMEEIGLNYEQYGHKL